MPHSLYFLKCLQDHLETSHKLNVKMLLFEGGKSLDINESVTDAGVQGVKRL
jgi:hypothetical protein